MEDKTEIAKPDAGLESINHYKTRLPLWRYWIRNVLLPIVRCETPYVALLQSTLRSSFLDSYFAFVANLGTHTFFMMILPMLFWCGQSTLARAMVHMLGAGVFFSGFIKDMVCLPRPLSPPLQRISMSDSAMLEYGFPSTHATNAMSVAAYCLYILKNDSPSMDPTINITLQGLVYFYAVSIVMGRLYCGMHGFLDVFGGSLIGALMFYIQIVVGPTFDVWLYQAEPWHGIVLILVILILVRVHPEPADDCPCFDDSVAFAGTLIGINAGAWHYSRSPYSWSDPVPGTVPYQLDRVGWLFSGLRLVLGVLLIFAWRGIMKPGLLRVLPPLFRLIEHRGLTLPRRFFLPASQYSKVPQIRNADNVIPHARDIPQLLRRRRAVSIGPQSQADAHEILAYRDKVRRDSLGGGNPPHTTDGLLSPPGASNPDHFQSETKKNGSETPGEPRRRSSSIDEFRAQMGVGNEQTNLLSPAMLSPAPPTTPAEIAAIQQAEEIEVFSRIEKPRVRYDVEVVTKLIVYIGIGWIAAEGAPLMFFLARLSID